MHWIEWKIDANLPSVAKTQDFDPNASSVSCSWCFFLKSKALTYKWVSQLDWITFTQYNHTSDYKSKIHCKRHGIFNLPHTLLHGISRIVVVANVKKIVKGEQVFTFTLMWFYLVGHLTNILMYCEGFGNYAMSFQVFYLFSESDLIWIDLTKPVRVAFR